MFIFILKLIDDFAVLISEMDAFLRILGLIEGFSFSKLAIIIAFKRGKIVTLVYSDFGHNAAERGVVFITPLFLLNKYSALALLSQCSRCIFGWILCCAVPHAVCACF